MAVEANKAIVQQLYDRVFNAGEFGAIADLVSSDARDHSPDLFPGQSSWVPGRVVSQAEWFRRAFPDAAWTIDGMVAERDKVVLRATFRGTHTADFVGLPPTGKSVQMLELRGFRIGDGKIVELWGSAETFGLRHQLGDAPELGPRRAAE